MCLHRILSAFDDLTRKMLRELVTGNMPPSRVDMVWPAGGFQLDTYIMNVMYNCAVSSLLYGIITWSD